MSTVIKRAIISVSDKTGLQPLAEALQRAGVEIISSGGTATYLKSLGVSVVKVSDYTGAPEVLDGRVKTLHPRVHAGILAKATEAHQQELAAQNIPAIDLVVVNLYPFEQTIAKPGVTEDEALEQIDIGGPTMVRAAAKNHPRVCIVVDPADYPTVIEKLSQPIDDATAAWRRQLAAKAFAHVADYDAAISNYFVGHELGDTLHLALGREQSLRYGENPHQTASFFSCSNLGYAPRDIWQQLHGKELSYNNILDLEAAAALVAELPQAAITIIKHTNPCGAALGTDNDLVDIYQRALAVDPVSAFGGILACNRPFTLELANALKELFLEVVIAPSFTNDALAQLSKKKNLRVIVAKLEQWTPRFAIRSAACGLLVQTSDNSEQDLKDAKVVSSRSPTAEERRALEFAWRIGKHVKSNAIVLAKADQLIGVGAGQMSRIDSVRLAKERAVVPIKNAVLASDAFFPFRDGIDAAAAAGATAIIQPGGSVRDDEVIAAANEHNLAMLCTGIRHFRH